MEHNSYCDSIGKNHRGSPSANMPFNVNKILKKVSSQCHQYNGLTLFNQEKHPDCRNPVVTPEQTNISKPVDTEVDSMTSEGDPDLTTYMNDFLKTNEPEQ